jgi:hypothetical protein
VEDVAKCLGWGYEGVETGWHVFAIPLDAPLLKSPKVYIREEPGRYVGRGAVPAGELTFEILIEKAGETYRWLFRGVQRGLIQHAGQAFFRRLGQPPCGEDSEVSLIDSYVYHHALVFVL